MSKYKSFYHKSYNLYGSDTLKGFLKIITITIIFMCMFTKTTFADGTFTNFKDIEMDIYKHLENRDEKFSFVYIGTTENFKNNISPTIKKAYSKDDYLERSWLLIQPKAKVKSYGIETSIEAKYLSTKEEEDYVDRELKKAVDSIISYNMSDFEKVFAINDYIINRYEYDYTLNSISPYSALTKSVAVCQGYAMTAYKMLEYAGIENKIIVGTAKNISHAWNIVKIDGEWYQLDTTNNDSILNKNKYFLVDDGFLENKGYVWDRSKYPISTSIY